LLVEGEKHAWFARVEATAASRAPRRGGVEERGSGVEGGSGVDGRGVLRRGGVERLRRRRAGGFCCVA